MLSAHTLNNNHKSMKTCSHLPNLEIILSQYVYWHLCIFPRDGTCCPPEWGWHLRNGQCLTPSTRWLQNFESKHPISIHWATEHRSDPIHNLPLTHHRGEPDFSNQLIGCKVLTNSLAARNSDQSLLVQAIIWQADDVPVIGVHPSRIYTSFSLLLHFGQECRRKDGILSLLVQKE